ncbi:hypothetical protein [Chitinophaga eiseniae]|uniref:hypothetical protein n=1 Tax=Chitinophaga eiseniae TaxID=634771 RepID=UPI00099A5BB8|nr:hypothetical protein [Chitinophaga eiseniae]
MISGIIREEIICDYLISCFASKPFRWNADFTLRTGVILKRETRKQKDTANDYSRAILQHSDGEVYRYDLPAQQPKAVSQRFNGGVYVLVNRQT